MVGPGSAHRRSGVNPVAVSLDIPRYLGRRPSLIGRIFQTAERPAEPPDFDPWLWLARLLALTLLVGLGLIAYDYAYRRMSLVLIGLFLGFFWLMSRLRGAGVLMMVALFGFGRLFGNLFGGPQQLLPVRHCRLLDDQNQEHIIRIKGRIIRGDIDQEDRFAIWGRRRHGTWLFSRGFNVRPRSWVLVEGSYTWISALILALLNLWLAWELSTIYPQWFF